VFDVVGGFIIHEETLDGDPWEYHECNNMGGTPIVYQNEDQSWTIECGVCVGWVYHDSGYQSDGNFIITTTVPLMGAEGGYDEIAEYYSESGDSVNLKLYDSSTGGTYNISSYTARDDDGVEISSDAIIWSSLGQYHINEEIVATCDGFTCENGACVESVDDSDCIAGCTDFTACNYDPDATDNDSSCTYSEEFYDCNGDCINDSDNDGVCDELSNDNLSLPDAFDIIAIYPNPFNPSTQISYTLNSIQHVNIRVLDSNGQEIEVLANNLEGIGEHQLQWVPKSNLASGSYFIMIGTINNSIAKKVTYIK
jgi:hypothetical protein